MKMRKLVILCSSVCLLFVGCEVQELLEGIALDAIFDLIQSYIVL